MDQKYKDTVEGELLDAIIVGLEQEKVKEPELPTIANFIIENLDKVQDQKQLIAFLDTIAKKWPIFQNVATMEEGKLKRFIEVKMSQQAMKLLQAGQPQAAANLARKIMQVQV